jgi:cold shock CspA family protein
MSEKTAVIKREYKGILDFYKKKLGYGFINIPEIEGKDKEPDMFLHYSNVPDELLPLLVPGAKIEFDLGVYDHPKKGEMLSAINVIVNN